MKADESAVQLSKYRLETTENTYHMAELFFDNQGYRYAVNRSYYATFYALRAVLALEGVDFKHHKDVVSYFNQHYVATGKFERDFCFSAVTYSHPEVTRIPLNENLEKWLIIGHRRQNDWQSVLLFLVFTVFDPRLYYNNII